MTYSFLLYLHFSGHFFLVFFWSPPYSLFKYLVSGPFSTYIEIPRWFCPGHSLPGSNFQVWLSIHGQSPEFQTCTWICSMDISICISSRSIWLNVFIKEVFWPISYKSALPVVFSLVNGTIMHRNVQRKKNKKSSLRFSFLSSSISNISKNKSVISIYKT